MNVAQLLKKLDGLRGDMVVVIRGENVIADIAFVYVDHDHTDDSEFLAIDLENEE